MPAWLWVNPSFSRGAGAFKPGRKDKKMEIKQIKEIAKTMKDNELTLVRICEGEKTLQMERNPQIVNSAPFSYCAPLNNPPAEPAEKEKEKPNLPGGETVDFNRLSLVKSPMVGVFYAAPSPDAAPFVEVGSKVKKGDILCIIEAMKIMNEICAETEGEIVDICVNNGDVVEYSQVLFKIF